MVDEPKNRRQRREERCGFDRRGVRDRRNKQELLTSADRRLGGKRRKGERREGEGRRESERPEPVETPYKSYKGGG